MLVLKERNVKLQFEDWGQNILEWTIDPTGRVVDTQPERSLYVGQMKVLNKEFTKGMVVQVEMNDGKTDAPYLLDKATEI